ncbi:MAG: ferrochelatase, partial [Verrucomicrobiota bacterium]
AMATTGACIAAVRKVLKNRATLRVVPPFYKHPAFIQPLAESLADVDEHLLFSYHGLPIRHLKKMDSPDYRVQCMETTKAIVAKAGIPEERYSVSFQSRLGRAKWMEPYTEQTLQDLPQQGIKRLAVVCPGFFCNCLETLEEIGVRGRKTFMEAGGESFRMIPCLNDSPAAVKCLESLINDVGNRPIYPHNSSCKLS